MYPIGTKVTTQSGITGVVVALFADGAWAKKFLECPWCDKATWEISTAEADFTGLSGPHYLIVDQENRWRLVYESRTGPVRDRIVSGEILY